VELNSFGGFAVNSPESHSFNYNNLTILSAKGSVPNPPTFMMSFFRIPKGVLEKIDYYRSKFFWHCDGHKKKYRLAKWSILHKPKSVRGWVLLIWIHKTNAC
jgi:hypothetical protein